ncbi:serine/threonine-protein kinase [Geothrix alkalitolerans]|uniref:serine/threonine-protein kinase n=1 Tax=Geothrix alkalitolerans TaxID=2922724 RepID=UPI001FB003A0|nr:serine/threonine-protein kinase [Geothrix alkalitolerans]
MPQPMSWYRTLAWTFFLRQAAAIAALIALILWVAYSEAERGARATAAASLSAGRYVVERAFEQQGRSLDAGLEVFTEYSGNLALVEQALESGASASLADTLADNLPRLGADLALVVKPDGTLLSTTGPGGRTDFPEAGILQMALAPEEAETAGHPGPSYRGFLRVDWGNRPGVYHAVARPLRSPGGRALGAMLVGVRVDDRIALDLRRMAVAGPQRGDPAPHLVLLSRFQTLGATLPGSGELDRLLAREPSLLAVRARVLDGQGSGVLPFRVGGLNYLGLVSPIRGVNALDLEMADVLLMPVDPLLAPFRNLQRAILAAGAVGLLVTLGLSLRSARKVTAPLKELATATEALAAGEHPGPLALMPSPDEVGVLTRTFKSMVAELKAKDELLALLAATRRPSASSPPVRDDEATLRLAPPAAMPADEPLPGPLRIGETFAGRYRVERLLGRGGMGVVLQVRDLQLDEEVALKVVRPALASVPAFLDRLKQEIRLARRISHRYVLRIHDFGESEGIPFVTMEYLRGTTLRELLEGRGRLPLPLALRITRQVAEGLEAAHLVGVVHRDIKPANVLFDTRGDAKIMDFGLAAPATTPAPGDSGNLIGSPRYMSPEQIRGGVVDARTDLYALGVMLFELCAGSAPFDTPRIEDLLALHLDAPPPSLGEAVPDLPPDLGLLVARLMAKRPEDRPQSAAEVVEILKALAAHGGATSRL